ncbi:HpcH/HpaI aldolase/citrate lyase family protein [Candidatus Hydrogenedentota bacterium]
MDPEIQLLKHRIKAGEKVVGPVVNIGNTATVEALGLAGFDFLWFDLEHSPMGLETLFSLIPACITGGARPIVRVPWNDPAMVKRVLDMGVDGIIVPMVCSAQEAGNAVAAMRYPPEGIRGIASYRAHDYGFSFADYVASADARQLTIMQAEHISAVNNIEAIAAVKGVDLIFIGTNDLCASMGHMGKTGHPEVLEAVNTITRACRKQDIPTGIYAGTPELANEFMKEGHSLILLGSDIGHFARHMKGIVEKVEK